MVAFGRLLPVATDSYRPETADWHAVTQSVSHLLYCQWRVNGTKGQVDVIDLPPLAITPV